MGAVSQPFHINTDRLSPCQGDQCQPVGMGNVELDAGGAAGAAQKGFAGSTDFDLDLGWPGSGCEPQVLSKASAGGDKLIAFVGKTKLLGPLLFLPGQAVE